MTLHARNHSDASSAHGAHDTDERALLDQYVRAWESTDLDAFVNLLKEDATYSMPPWHQWYRGREAIRWLFSNVWKAYGGFRLLPTYANDQPAFALYTRADASAGWNAHSLQVLAIQNERISALTMFMKPLATSLFPAFRLSLTLES